MRRATLLIVIALLLFGGLGTIVIRRGATLVYELTFNHTEPFGTDEDSDGTSDCLTHDATATNAYYWLCECTTCDEQEGDADLLYYGAIDPGQSYTMWESVFASQSDIWIEAHFYADGAGITAVPLLVQANGAGILAFALALSTSNRFKLKCDGPVVYSANSSWTTQVWMTLLLHFDFDAGAATVWKDGSGTPLISCSGGIGSKTSDGFTLWGNNEVNVLAWDHIRIWDSDPR